MSRVRHFRSVQPPIPAASTWLGRASRRAALVGALLLLLLVLPYERDPSIVIGGVLAATFLAAAPTGRGGAIAPLDVLMAALAVGALAYRPDAVLRLGAGGVPTWTDVLAAAAFLMAVAEAGRRVAGWPALIGVLLWAGALVIRDRLPGDFHADPIDPAAVAAAMFYRSDGLLATSFALVAEWFIPIVIFAAMARAARLMPLLAGLVRPFGAAPLATALSAPFLLEPDGRAGSGPLPTLRMLLPLMPPAIGFAALLVGQAIGNVGEVLWRLLPPAGLALIIVVARRRTDRWRLRWPEHALGRPQIGRATIGPALVLAAPLAVLLLLLVVPPSIGFGVGTVLLLVGAFLSRPAWTTIRELLRALLWAARQAPMAGALLFFLAVVERLNESSGLLPALGEAWFDAAPALGSLLFVLLALAAGALFFPAAAIGFVMLVSGSLVADPAGAFIAALFWIGGAAILAERPQARAILGRTVWATPLLLVALVATRAAFDERGLASPLLLLLDAAAAVAVGLAVGARAPIGGVGRALLFLLGVFLLSPRAEFAVLLVVGAVAAIMIATVTGRPTALDARRWRPRKLVSRINPPRLPGRSSER